jgi:hypothetical protein
MRLYDASSAYMRLYDASSAYMRLYDASSAYMRLYVASSAYMRLYDRIQRLYALKRSYMRLYMTCPRVQHHRQRRGRRHTSGGSVHRAPGVVVRMCVLSPRRKCSRKRTLVRQVTYVCMRVFAYV